MKKALTTAVLITYFFSGLGIGLREFYCFGKLKAVTVVVGTNATARCGKDCGHNGCCKTKYQYFKVKDDQLITPGAAIPPQPSIELYHIASFLHGSFHDLTHRAQVDAAVTPPRGDGVPIHIYQCVYRI
jgi:hypothetical protein